MSSKPHCQYGAGCIRKNPDHFVQFQHPQGVGVPVSPPELFVSRFFKTDVTSVPAVPTPPQLAVRPPSVPTAATKKRVLPEMPARADAAVVSVVSSDDPDSVSARPAQPVPSARAPKAAASAKPSAPKKPRKKADVVMTPADAPAAVPAKGAQLTKMSAVNLNEKLTSVRCILTHG
jgi:hypothetical protein